MVNYRDMSFGTFVANRRKFLNLTQDQLAEKIHVSKSAIAKWETDGGIPDRDNLCELGKILNVSVDDMHKIIGNSDASDDELEINITKEVITMLESYGYVVIPPNVNEEEK